MSQPRLLPAILLLGALAVGCSDSDDGACSLREGDLVITEIVPDPTGSDTGAEWFEIYNASGADIDLRDLRVVQRNGQTVKGDVIKGDEPIILAAGGYAVIAAGPLGLGEVYVYAETFGTLNNSGGELRILCENNATIDSVCYGDECDPEGADTGSGESIAFGGESVPEYLSNDDGTRWCVQQPTPGAANASCGGGGGDGGVGPGPGCEGGVVPTADDARVRITEVLADAEEEPAGEWVEIQITDGPCVDLTGMRVTNEGADEGGFQLEPGAGLTGYAPGHYVFAGSAANVGDAPVAYPLGESLRNSGDTVLALYLNGELLDQVTYDVAGENIAWQRDPTDPESGCARPPIVEGGPAGSPGRANPSCTACTCLEGEQMREVAAPAPGDLLITEAMFNVPGTEGDNAAKEWFEVQVSPSAPGPVFFNCMEIAKGDGSSAATFAPAQCQPFEPGDHVLFGRSTDPAQNGGIAPDLIYDTADFTTTQGLSLYGAGQLIDAVPTWTDPGDGVALQVDQAALADWTPASNDDVGGNWCAAQAVYNDALGARGTPGAPNLVCGGCYCREGGELVLGDPPLPGELVVTEVMGDPEGGDGGREWVELWSGAPTPRHLNCVQLVFSKNGVPDLNGADPLPVPGEVCTAIAPGAHMVLCDAEGDNGLAECLVHDAGALPNDPAGVYLGVNGSLVAEGLYPDPVSGTSAMLSTDAVGGCDFSYTDAELRWCEAPEAAIYWSDPEGRPHFGTPGEMNPCCAPAE